MANDNEIEVINKEAALIVHRAAIASAIAAAVASDGDLHLSLQLFPISHGSGMVRLGQLATVTREHTGATTLQS
jgi:hypothetical protein